MPVLMMHSYIQDRMFSVGLRRLAQGNGLSGLWPQLVGLGVGTREAIEDLKIVVVKVLGIRGPWRLSTRLVLSLAFLPAVAEAGNFSIDWFTVAGGGMRSYSDKYALNGTVGQPAAGKMANGNFSVIGGFWSFIPGDGAGGSSVSADLATGPYAGIDLTDPAQAQADLDGDGVPNLMEYALGTDPRNPADAANAMSMSLTNSGAGQYLTLSFKRRQTSAITLQYIPECSGDGQTWSAANVGVVGVTTLDSQFDWVTVMDVTPTTVGAPRFIRLRVVEN